MTETEFLRPRLHGARFEGHAIPLDVLSDLAVLEEMVIEVAKWHFLQDHAGRRRSPRHFADGVELRLQAVEDGSAIPVILLVVLSNLLPGTDQNLPYLRKACTSIVSAIDAAEHDRKITDHLPEKALGYFDRLGRSLQDGESIEFRPSSVEAPARLTRESRRRLVLASPRVEEMTEDVTVRALVPEADKDAKTFHVQLADGRKVKAPLAPQHLDVVSEAFLGYEAGTRVVVSGVGRFDRQNHLRSFDVVEHVTVLDALDIEARLTDLAALGDGWLDGKGRGIEAGGAGWLTMMFAEHLGDDGPLPHLYPTPEGAVLAEWRSPPLDISLEVDLQRHTGAFHQLNLATDVDEERQLDLDAPTDWEWLSARLTAVGGEG